MTTCFLPTAKLAKLIGQFEPSAAFAPTRTDKLAWLDSADAASPQALSEPRAVQSFKGFFFPTAESVGQYGSHAASVATQAPPLVLFGLRACELKAMQYLDKVFLQGEYEDSPYRQRREAATVVSCDCVDCAESCFCTLVGGQPFCAAGYDVNLTPVDGGFVADVATEKGSKLLGSLNLAAAPDEQIARRDEIRKQMTDRVNAQNAEFGFTAGDDAAVKLPDDDDEAWQQFAADCVECGACTHICPTCYCFYLYDQLLGPEAFERIRTWDSCLLSTYHKMAGGPNMKLTPRPRLRSRLANRVLHKFNYSPQQYGMQGCVGCGRCVDACPGAIDIRQVVKELSG